MSNIKRIIESWWILISVSGLLLIIFSGSLAKETNNILLYLHEKDPQTELLFRPVYLEDEKHVKIGWWQIRLTPSNVMIGDTAVLEVSYHINPDLFIADQRPSNTPEEQYISCVRENQRGRHWSAPQSDCGEKPSSVKGLMKDNDPAESKTSLSSLGVSIHHSDLPYSPNDGNYEMKASDIFQSPSKSGNRMWRLNAASDAIKPGKKNLIISLTVNPANFQSKEINLSGIPVKIFGNNVALEFDVLTPAGFSRSTSALFELGYAILGAVFSSAFFLTLLKWWLERRPTPPKKVSRGSKKKISTSGSS